MSEIKTEFFKIGEIEKHFTGVTINAARQYCKQGLIRFNKCGNRIILNEIWLKEDLDRLAVLNRSTSDKVITIGKLRRVEV